METIKYLRKNTIGHSLEKERKKENLYLFCSSPNHIIEDCPIRRNKDSAATSLMTIPPNLDQSLPNLNLSMIMTSLDSDSELNLLDVR